MILRAEELGAAYGGRAVLDGVSLEIADRAITAIVGPSGCGKSTFLRALDRTLELTPGARLTRGRVLFRDVDAASLDAQDLRRRIGLLPQRPVPFPMSIRENVLFGLRYHGRWEGRTPDAAAKEHLEEAGLWEEVKGRLGEPATSLSAGQQQRLGIARLLANRPELLLMDEPTSSLDPKATSAIEDLALRLKCRMPIVIVTHNLAQARRIADRVAVFGEGRLLEAGPAQELFAGPKDSRAAAYLAGT